jgi:hypothetical protein
MEVIIQRGIFGSKRYLASFDDGEELDLSEEEFLNFVLKRMNISLFKSIDRIDENDKLKEQVRILTQRVKGLEKKRGHDNRKERPVKKNPRNKPRMSVK